jgi:uncharacterized protein with FMN-binding domain
MKKIFLYIIAVALALTVIAVAIFVVTIYPKIREQTKVRHMTINDVELAKINDGTFRGDFTYGNFKYEVQVTVQEHRIQQIDVLKNREESEYAKKAEGVVEKVLKSQSLKVDAVTGATTTSKALLKAIESALTKGLAK